MYAVPISLIQVLGAILDLYAFILIARALISWVSPGSRNKIVQFLYQITEPVLAPVRQVVPPIGGLDLSLVVVLIVIQVLRAFLIPY